MSSGPASDDAKSLAAALKPIILSIEPERTDGRS
jgi:hypothetical protein